MENDGNEIRAIEQQIWALTRKLTTLRRDASPQEVKNYEFSTSEGATSLLKLFAGQEVLFAIHNMGQACRYCTLWADGLNAFLPHLEDKFAVVLLSKDAPEVQRRFANARGWRFRMASHGGGEYIREQSVGPEAGNQPGVVCYIRSGDRIFRKNSSSFGPGDQFCSFWHLLSLAGHGEETVTPQYNYWRMPSQLEDGGENVLSPRS